MPRWNNETDGDRFWRKVQKGPDCWEWTASKDTGGYGQFWLKGQTHPWKASRVAYLLTYHDPGQMHVLHRCDNPACVRPDHLFLGTHLDNIRDRTSKGRGRNNGGRGEKNANARLTLPQVIEIRQLYSAGRHTQTELAQSYGVGQTAISKIVRGEKWPEGY